MNNNKLMETTQTDNNPNACERMLSFQLSQVLTPKDLKEISGGAQRNGTSTATGNATYHSHGGTDASADVNYDL